MLWLRDRYIDTVESCQYLSENKIIKCVECRGEQYDAGGYSPSLDYGFMLKLESVLAISMLIVLGIQLR